MCDLLRGSVRLTSACDDVSVYNHHAMHKAACPTFNILLPVCMSPVTTVNRTTPVVVLYKCVFNTYIHIILYRYEMYGDQRRSENKTSRRYSRIL